MTQQNIENLDKLLTKYLSKSNQKKSVTGQEIERLTANGDNYGSVMLAVDVKVKADNNDEEIIKAVAKIPPLSDFIQKMFNTAVTFKYEIDFYNHLLPELQNFIINNNQEVEDVFGCFPETYGARLSIDNNSETVDNSAVLLLENLKVAGFECVDRTVGFDFGTAKLILKSLAKLHAVPVAMKLKNPEQFQEIIKSQFKEYRIFQVGEEMQRATINKIISRLQETDDEECKRLVDKARTALEKSVVFTKLPKNSPQSAQEPFATIVHTDTWVNNFMIKFAPDKNTPEEVKIVDFQLYEYSSPARDILFFIFTSVQISVVDDNYDDLIGAYHEEFIRILTKFGCDTSQFSLDALESEFDFAVKRLMFWHIMAMLEPIFAVQENVPDLDSMGIEHFSKEIPVTQKYKERAAFVVKKFNNNNWL